MHFSIFDPCYVNLLLRSLWLGLQTSNSIPFFRSEYFHEIIVDGLPLSCFWYSTHNVNSVLMLLVI